MANTKLTEKMVMDKLVAVAKAKGELSPKALVMQRTQGQKSANRVVRIALVVAINNETLVDALITECIANDNDFYFIGSEAQLQGEMQVDYLFFDASIYVKQT